MLFRCWFSAESVKLEFLKISPRFFAAEEMNQIPSQCVKPAFELSFFCFFSLFGTKTIFSRPSSAGGCGARVVTVSPGPLIRVEGQPVSIRCDVNEYGGPREQVRATGFGPLQRPGGQVSTRI